MSDGTAHRPSSRPDPDDAVAAYALGVLDPEERQEFEAHLAGCPTCRAALSRHEEVVGAVGSSVTPVAPRPGLRDALLAEIRAPAPPAALPAPRRLRVLAIGSGIAASIALVSVAVLSLLLARALDERDEARHSAQEIAEYISDGGTLSALLPAAEAPPVAAPGHGSLVVAPDQSQAMLVVHDLTPSGDDRRYIAWAERDGERVELGVLPVNDEGVGWLLLSGREPMSAYETVGITRYSEQAPEGEPFLVAPIE
ncbi:MAG TPA: anti-sigma factor [Thermomicrobiales bacterium]|nr:anti-sigma factor [Thermomicrobiales bacterium]